MGPVTARLSGAVVNLIRLAACAALMLLLFASGASAATKVSTYSPIDEDGTLRDGLVVERGGTAECWVESFAAYQAVRCIAGSLIRDPCFVDTRREEDAVLCVSDPWSRVALAYDVPEGLPELAGADVTPWALTLANGLRCSWTQGAGLARGSFRLNYYCTRPRGKRVRMVLYGSPNRTRSTWTIRGARSERSHKLFRVKIETAWR